MREGRAERVRLWGIDCPERGQPFGTRARQFTGDLAFGKDVKVIVHDTDCCGRTVGEVILPNGRNLNQALVRAGLAWWYVRHPPRSRSRIAGGAEARRGEARAVSRQQPGTAAVEDGTCGCARSVPRASTCRVIFTGRGSGNCPLTLAR